MYKISLKILRGEVLVRIQECSLNRRVIFCDSDASCRKKYSMVVGSQKIYWKIEVFIRSSFFLMRTTSLSHSSYFIS